MNREEVKEIVLKITHCYGDRFKMTQPIFDDWVEELSDLRYAPAKRAVSEVIRTSEYPPTIADIRNKYMEFYEEYKAMVKHINETFNSATGNYPSLTEEQWERGHITFIGIVNRYPREQKERIANALGDKIRTFVQEWERGSEQTIIGLDEFMERMKDEFSG